MALSNKELIHVLNHIQDNKKLQRRRFCIVCRVNDRKYFLADWDGATNTMYWTRNTANMVQWDANAAKIMFDDVRDSRFRAKLYLMDAHEIMEAYPPKHDNGDVT